MKAEFIRKVLNERTIDTKEYRYTVEEHHDSDQQWAEIRRIRLADLDTTAALDQWELVYSTKQHYQIRVKSSPMEIIGVPMWPGVWYDTREEAEKALEKAREEIRSTWTSPEGVPVWIEAAALRPEWAVLS